MMMMTKSKKIAYHQEFHGSGTAHTNGFPKREKWQIKSFPPSNPNPTAPYVQESMPFRFDKIAAPDRSKPRELLPSNDTFLFEYSARRPFPTHLADDENVYLHHHRFL